MKSSVNLLDKIGFLLFLALMFLFYVIPDQVQLPIRVLMLIGLFFIFLLAKIGINFSLFDFLSIIGLGIVLLLSLYAKSIHPSLLIVVLSFFPLLMSKELCFKVTEKRKKILDVFTLISSLGIIIQIFIFRYEGRPSLSYEINLSGAFLFLFFLFCDSRGIRFGKYLVFFCSALLLSRLLVFSLILFYVTRYLKKILPSHKVPRLSVMVIVACIVTCIFSGWYTYTMADSIINDNDGQSRLSTLNDGSNFLRFKTNAQISFNLVSNRDTKLINGGYGDVAMNKDYVDEYVIMPHNEILKSIAEFGLIATLFFLIVTLRKVKFFYCYENFEYFIAIIFYTQILWVRLAVVPSLEMIFLIFIANIKQQQSHEKTFVINR